MTDTFGFQESTVTPLNQGVVTSWFVNTRIEAGASFVPRENIYLKSDKTEGAWDTLLNRVKEVSAWDKINVEITSINLHQDYQPSVAVVDTELDTLLDVSVPTTPLFVKKSKVEKAPIFAFINVEISSEYVSGKPLRGYILIRTDMAKSVLSAVLAQSKELTATAVVVGLVDPRVKEVCVLQALDF